MNINKAGELDHLEVQKLEFCMAFHFSLNARIKKFDPIVFILQKIAILVGNGVGGFNLFGSILARVFI